MSATRILVALACLVPSVASGQTPASIDAVAAAPDRFTVLLENEHVRVVQYTLQPGERDQWHTHPPKVSYVVAGGQLRIHLSDGTSFLSEEKQGSAVWMDALPRHYAENVGTTPLRIILVEMDRAQAQQVRKGFAAITVSDLSASEEWYRAHLGTRRLSESRSPSGHAENVVVGNDYFIFELIKFAEPSPTDTVTTGSREIGLKKVGIWVDAAAFDSTHQRLTELSARFVGGTFTDARLKARSFLVKDNSGVIIQFFAPVP